MPNSYVTLAIFHTFIKPFLKAFNSTQFTNSHDIIKNLKCVLITKFLTRPPPFLPSADATVQNEKRSRSDRQRQSENKGKKAWKKGKLFYFFLNIFFYFSLKTIFVLIAMEVNRAMKKGYDAVVLLKFVLFYFFSSYKSFVEFSDAVHLILSGKF